MSVLTWVPLTARVEVCFPLSKVPWVGVKLSPETSPELVRQETVALAVNPVIMHDIAVSEPFFTSLLFAVTSEIEKFTITVCLTTAINLIRAAQRVSCGAATFLVIFFID